MMKIRTFLLMYTFSCCAHGIAGEVEQEQSTKELQHATKNYWQLKQALQKNWSEHFHFTLIPMPSKQTLLRLLPDAEYAKYHTQPSQLVYDIAQHLSKQKTIKCAQMSDCIHEGLQTQYKYFRHCSPAGLLLLQFHVEGTLMAGLLNLRYEGPIEAGE